ncbi:MAG: serine hydrolase [Acidobacteriota bacterium]
MRITTRRNRVPAQLACLAVVTATWITSTAFAAECGASSTFRPNPLITDEERCRLEAWALETGSSALLVSVGGETVFELETERSETPIHIMSVTKSVASLAIGRLIQEGKIDSLDLPLSELFPEWRQGRKAEITLLHLLTHATGLQDIPNAGVEIEPSEDVVQLALAAELAEAPGAAFRYNNKASNLLTAVVEERSGRKLDDYLRQTVFADLGISDAEWLRDSADNPYGMAGLFLAARDLVKIGQLMNQRGTWNGEQLIDREFAEQALTSQRNDYDRVGLLWWLLADWPSGYQANGWLGQWLMGLPEAGAVVVRLVDRADATGDGGGEFLDLMQEVLTAGDAAAASTASPEIAAEEVAAGKPPESQPPSVTLPPELDRVLRDYEQAWREGDPEGLAALFTADGYVLSHGRPPVVGRAAITERYKGSGGSLYLRAFHYQMEGDVGFILGGYTYEEGAPDRGKFTLALARNADGRWLIVSDMDNSNRSN